MAEDDSVFEHPGFADHVDFLQRLAAAGPLDDGDSLTVIQADSLDQASELATEEDPSVRNGVLEVTVRPWQLMLAPILDA